jgi:hypothetical protein
MGPEPQQSRVISRQQPEQGHDAGGVGEEKGGDLPGEGVHLAMHLGAQGGDLVAQLVRHALDEGLGRQLLVAHGLADRGGDRLRLTMGMPVASSSLSIDSVSSMALA